MQKHKCENCGSERVIMVEAEDNLCHNCIDPIGPDGLKLAFMVMCESRREAEVIVGTASYMETLAGREHRWHIHYCNDTWVASIWIKSDADVPRFEYDDAMDLYEGACQE